MALIHIAVPSVPISANHAYVTGRGGRGRFLSKEGKAYKNETKAYIAQHYMKELQFFRPDVPYIILVSFTFRGRETLYSATWPDEAKNRYKKLDVTNRTKLFEDAFSEATGIDDSANFFTGVGKTWTRDYETTDVWVWNREDEPDNPIDVLFRRLRDAAEPAEPHRALPEL